MYLLTSLTGHNGATYYHLARDEMMHWLHNLLVSYDEGGVDGQSTFVCRIPRGYYPQTYKMLTT